MKVLIDIGHPAHVHYFKHLAWHMLSNGSSVLFTCREKEFEIELLKEYGFRYQSFGKKYKNLIGKIFGLLKFDILELIEGIKFKPDIFLSAGSIYAAHAAWILRRPHISLEDTGNMEQVRLYLPASSVVLSPYTLKQDLGSKMIRFRGINELTYLHPKRYKKSENSNHVDIAKPYALLRFVSWNATHDVGQSGLTANVKLQLVDFLQSKMNVYISSEGKLPADLAKYKIEIHPSQMHEALQNAELFIGEGTTMAAEAGVLGTPAFYVNSLEGCNISILKDYKLVWDFRSDHGVLEELKENINELSQKNIFIDRSKNFTDDHIDVTGFLIWFIETYPESFETMKSNPDFQNNFRTH